MAYYGGDPIQTNAAFLMERLMRGGMSRMQAAAIVGNLRQESALVSNNVNTGEGAYGLMQWRGDRFTALQQFASQQGKSWTDPGVQADFIGHELRSSERGNAGDFYRAGNLDAATEAFGRGVVRFGDKSLPTRQSYARDVYGSEPGQPEPIAGQQVAGQKVVESQSPVSRGTSGYDEPRYSAPRGIRQGIAAFGRGLAQAIDPRTSGLGSVFSGAGASGTGSTAPVVSPPALPQAPAFPGAPRPETAPSRVAPGSDAVRAPAFNVARMGALADQGLYEDGDWYG